MSIFELYQENCTVSKAELINSKGEVVSDSSAIDSFVRYGDPRSRLISILLEEQFLVEYTVAPLSV